MAVNHSHIPTMGQRVRRFRELRGKTQQELELGIDTAFGHISRIESDKVNPSKETLLKIADVLKLRTCELNYFLGVTVEPASRAEIDDAIREVQAYFDKKGTMAYLLDERWRYIAVSRSFLSVFSHGHPDEMARGMMGKPSPQVMIDKHNRETFVQSQYLSLIETMLSYYYSQTNFMSGDRYFQETSKCIQQHPDFKAFWEQLNRGTLNPSYIPLEQRYEQFFIDGREIEAVFSREPLMTNSRFEIHDYKFPEQDLERLDKAGLL